MQHAARLRPAEPAGRDERAAIIAAVRREADAFAAKDLAAWSACFLHSPRTTEVVSGVHGILVHRGWQAVSDAMAATMREEPEPLALPSRYVGFDVSISDDTAWVTYLSTCQVTGNERYDMPDIFETRILERRGEGWLIVYMSILSLRSGPADPARVLVGPCGRVVWAAEETLAALKDHPHLTISAGRLRAARPAWDKVLREAIGRAARVSQLSQFEKDPPRATEDLIIPVVLGEDDEGGVQSCVVYARDGGTYVTFDDGLRIARSLELARHVFGLSEAQTRLAGTITAGHGLTASARELGISVNTARTHLSRIYDKTGVGTQTALVRVLLGVGITAA